MERGVQKMHPVRNYDPIPRGHSLPARGNKDDGQLDSKRCGVSGEAALTRLSLRSEHGGSRVRVPKLQVQPRRHEKGDMGVPAVALALISTIHAGEKKIQKKVRTWGKSKIRWGERGGARKGRGGV